MSTKPRIITWMAIEIIEKASGMVVVTVKFFYCRE